MLTGDPYVDQKILINLPINNVGSFFEVDNSLDQEWFWELYLKEWYPNFVRKKSSAKEIGHLIYKWKNYKDYLEDHTFIDLFKDDWHNPLMLAQDFVIYDQTRPNFDDEINGIKISFTKPKEAPLYNEELKQKINLVFEEKKEELNFEFLDFLEERGEIINYTNNIYNQIWLTKRNYGLYFFNEFPYRFRRFWFLWLDHPLFDDLIKKFNDFGYFKEENVNTDLLWGIGKGKLIEKFGVKPTARAIIYTFYPFLCRYWNGLVKKEDIEKEEKQVMIRIHELVEKYNLKIPPDIYTQCLIHGWINGWRYFIDLNIQITQQDIYTIINKYQTEGIKWIKINKDLYSLLKEKNLLFLIR